MQPNTLPSDDAQAIAEKIRSGEFFRESRAVYDFDVHDPMAERYLYVLITSLSGLILLITIIAVQGLYPLQTSVPFIFNAANISNDVPAMRSLLAYKGESPSDAVLRFIAQNYVTLRESYDIDAFERNANGVKSQSSESVTQEFERGIDPRNADSPITLYQRHSKRKIAIISSRQIAGDTPGMEIVYDAVVESKEEIKRSRWQATIAFNYSGVTLDEDGKVKPLEFIVTQYKTRRM